MKNAEKATEIQNLRQTAAYREVEIQRIELHELGTREDTQNQLKRQFEDVVYKISIAKEDKSVLETQIHSMN